MLSISGFGDPLSALTHLAGATVFARLGVSLIRQGRGELPRTMSLVVFAFSGVLLLAVSGTYHLWPPDGAFREVLRRLDHAAIFVLIAGSFTPVHAILFRGPWRWGMLAGIWTVALAGLTLKTVYFTAIPEGFGLALYLGFGWLGLVSWIALVRRFGLRFARPVLWGGLAYTSGALTDFLGWPVPVPGFVGAHELFHLAVLAGLSFHWIFIRGFASREMLMCDTEHKGARFWSIVAGQLPHARPWGSWDRSRARECEVNRVPEPIRSSDIQDGAAFAHEESSARRAARGGL